MGMSDDPATAKGRSANRESATETGRAARVGPRAAAAAVGGPLLGVWNRLMGLKVSRVLPIGNDSHPLFKVGVHSKYCILRVCSGVFTRRAAF